MVCMDSYGVTDLCSWEFVVKTLALTLVNVGIVFGNSLVIVAVFTYKKLRGSVSNSFIASLAVADLFLGAAVLPLSTSLEVLGYWVFGQTMCTIWLAMDVWICTASILHLCSISFDRYLAIAFPLKYPNLMTHYRCKLICIAMWVLSFIISFPALVGWQDRSEVTENTENFTFHLSVNITASNATVAVEQCNVVAQSSLGYVLYSAAGSFYIPSFIMSGFYIKIFSMTRAYLSRRARSAELMQSASGNSLRIHRGSSAPKIAYQNRSTDLNVSTGSSDFDTELEKHTYSRSVSIDESMNRNFRTDLSSSGTNRERKSRNSATISIINWQENRKVKSNVTSSAMNRETRAAKTVSIIVGCFILCWAPFFICYVIQGLCKHFNKQGCVNEKVYQLVVWVGYINSLLNPCIYAYFSKDYKHAFKKILKCQLTSRLNRHQLGITRYIASLYVPSSSNDNSTSQV